MTATITFDTLQFVQRLKKAGVKEPEAEAIAEAVRDVQTNADVATKHDLAEVKAKLETSDLATTRDLTEIEAGLKRDLAIVEAKLEAKIAETKVEIERTKAELVRWVVSVGILQTILIAGLLLRLIPN
jgi:hypothetical protein